MQVDLSAQPLLSPPPQWPPFAWLAMAEDEARNAETPNDSAEELKKIILTSGKGNDALAKEIMETLKAEINIDTPSQLYKYFKVFSLPEFIKEITARNDKWKRNGPLTVCLFDTWKACDMLFPEDVPVTLSASPAKSRKSEKADSDEENEDMDIDINKSLQHNWVEAYKVPLHGTEELPSQLLNSMYKKLKRRKGEAEYVKGIYTKATKTPPSLSIEKRNKRQKVTPYIDLVVNTKDSDDKNGPSFHVDRSPWLFQLALENMLRSFCLAGSFKVRDPEATESDKNKLVLMVERELLEDHLHDCRAFILQWTNKPNRPPDADILQQLRRVEMNIRQKWWDLFCRNKPEGRTFTSCMKEAKFYAEQQWSVDFNLYLGPAAMQHQKGQQQQQQQQGLQVKTGVKTKLRGKGAKKKGKGKGKGAKGGAGQTGNAGALRKTTTWMSGGKKVEAAKNLGNKLFCHFYNQNSCRDNTGNCAHLHKCNVILPGGKICNQGHPASEHTGKHIEAS